MREAVCRYFLLTCKLLSTLSTVSFAVQDFLGADQLVAFRTQLSGRSGPSGALPGGDSLLAAERPRPLGG